MEHTRHELIVVNIRNRPFATQPYQKGTPYLPLLKLRHYMAHKGSLYRLYSKTRKFLWVMTQKLSETLSRKFFQSCGMVSRMNARIASANNFWLR